MIFILKSPEETSEFGAKIGKLLTGGEIILLEGDLGGGKTQFAKGLARGLGVEDTVTSPTYTIERQYPAGKNTLRHFDFYRLGGDDKELAEELREISGDATNILAIEWSENLKSFSPKKYLKLFFRFVDENTREIEVTSEGDKYDRILETLK